VNPSTALATVFVDEMVRGGVREAVLCPGSRSAPLAYALQEADAAGRLRLHVRVDERSAGFLALGLAKLTRRPVPVVTTSGTAVANLHPAVLEASHAGVPLLVLTADRPQELRGTGANQTTDQGGFFGAAVRWSHELAAPEWRAGQNGSWRSVVARACVAARGDLSGDAGPVHVNVPLREPLVPTVPATGEPGWPDGLGGRPGGAPWVQVAAPAGSAGTGGPDGTSRADSRISADGTTTVAGIDPTPRTLVVVGDLPRPEMAGEAVELARAVGWPVVAEPFGRFDRAAVLPHGPLLLGARDWLEAHLPERVLVVGRVTLARSVAALLRHPGVRVEVVATTADWADPSHVASRVWSWSSFAASRAALTGCGDQAWAEAWAEAGRRVAKAVGEVVGRGWPSGPAVAAVTAAALPADATLFVGSSNPVRDLDLAVGPGGLDAATRVVASRGLAGIDGCVSTAAGIALAGAGSATYALMGDLTFLHDQGGLLIGPHEPRPDLTVVVPNDDGGGIFTLLEPGAPERSATFERLFGTPTGTSIEALCRAHGVRHVLATTVAGLTEAVARRPDGITVVEVPLRRAAHRDLQTELRAAAVDALA
jgi:2-succinyl-5-enolpyruvyl-6-hydroxy-3-cyclohexene-1-carboxylate synthase